MPNAERLPREKRRAASRPVLGFGPKRRSPVLAYGMAVLAAVVATLLRAALTPIVGDAAVPFILFFPAVLFVGWYGGFRPAALCTLISALAGDYYFVRPFHTFILSTSGDETTSLIFVLVSLGIALLGDSQRRAVLRAESESESRKEAERAELGHRQRLQTTLSSIGDAVIATDPSGQVNFVNPVALGILRLSEAEVVGRHLDEFFRIVNEETRAKVESPVAKVLREGAIVGMANHTVLICPDGREVPIDDSAAPILHADGSLQGTVLVFRDISERRHAELTTLLLASIVESSQDAIISKDLNGIVTSWNRGAQRIFGYSAEEMIGQPISVIASSERKDEMPTILARIRNGERVEHYETVRRRKDGSPVEISLTVSPVRNASGKIIGASKIARDITRRREAEARLRRSQEETREARDWLQTTLASIGDAVIATDTQGKITFINRVAASLTGWSEADAAGRRLDEVFVIRNEETHATVESPVTKALREGRIVGLANHTELISTDGRHTPIDDSAAPITDAQGAVIGVVLVFRDVTERKLAERAVQESMERFRVMANQAPVLIWIAGLDKLCTWFNKPWLDFVGRTMEQELGSGWTGNVHPEDLDPFLKAYAGAFDARQPFKIEYRLRRSDGEYRWILDHGIPLYGPDGAFSGYIGSCIDITQLKTAEKRLTELQHQLQVELSGMRELHELGGRLLPRTELASLLGEILKTAEKITGADMGNLQLLDSENKLRIEVQHGLGEEFLQFFDAAEGEGACGAAQSRAERVIVEDVENSPLFAGKPALKVLRNAGVRSVQSTPIVNRGGELLGILSTHHRRPHQSTEHNLRLLDLLARQAADAIENARAGEALRKNAEELRAANRALVRANADLNQFAFAASHDLQEPLRIITSYSQLLVSGYRGSFEGEPGICVDFISSGTKRMRELLSDLLAYTQLTSDEQEQPQLIDLNSVCHRAIENLRTSIEETHASIQCGDLPALYGHSAHFVQLFQNLLGNAIKYRREQAPQIRVWCEREGQYWRFSVADNGIGIPPEYHEMIFGVFKRLHGKKIPGTGIGLAICQRVVERYGGRIWVESQEGRGAAFHFTVPAAEEPKGGHAG